MTTAITFLILIILVHLRGQVPWIGTVTKVIDGDSLEIRRGRKTVRVRLEGIDAPEYGQPFGKRSLKQLRSLTKQKRVLVMPRKRDRYNRTVAHVWAGRTNASLMLAWNGYAWGSSGLSRPVAYTARVARRGLWSQRHYVSPSAWRKANKERRRA